MTVIDVHTHMLSENWLAAIEKHGVGGDCRGYSVAPIRGGQRAIHLDGAPFMTLTEGMFDYATRIGAMDEAGVDIAVV